jgi:hypothetical protein
VKVNPFLRSKSGLLSSLRPSNGDSSGSRVLRKVPVRWSRNTLSSRRVNSIGRGFSEPIRYLEIGVQDGFTFEAIRARRRVGVEPFPRFSVVHLPRNASIFEGTSDQYFSSAEETFDVVFVDGLHEASQTYRDVVNSCRLLSSGGVILLDDVFPLDEASSLPSLEASEMAKLEQGIGHWFWYGDVYKVLGLIQDEHPELGIVLVGGDINHVQALIWRIRAGSEIRPSPSADALLKKWRFGDFFSGGALLRDIPILSEKQAIRLVLAAK